jgi:transcriptional regulator with XRE-family HTH domain
MYIIQYMELLRKETRGSSLDQNLKFPPRKIWMKKSKISWNQLLSHDAQNKLKEIGEAITIARKARRMTRIDLATRVGIDRRTLTELEKGSPKVSIGIFFQVLSILNLLRGLEEAFKPENDIETIHLNIRKLRQKKRIVKPIPDEKVNF